MMMNQISLNCLYLLFTIISACTQGKRTNADTSPQPIVAEVQSVSIQANTKAWLLESQKRLPNWYDFYGKSIQGFKADDFVLVDTFHEVEFVELDVTKLDPALAKYRIPSPNGKKQLDIYSYGRQLIPDKDGKLQLAAQSLESEVALYGMAVEKKLRLLFCGGYCQFDDAAWIDDDLLIVAGTSNETDQKNHPMIWGIKLSDKSVFSFIHPAVLTDNPNSFFNNVNLSK
jgi:hypothetical protein